MMTSSWVNEATDYLFIQSNPTFNYCDFSDDFSDVVNHCKKKLFNILKSKSSKESFIQMIEDNGFHYFNSELGTGDFIEDEVMDRLKDHLKSQSWEEICDGGDAFVNIVKFLIDEENFEGDEKWLICLPELDDENAIDWHWQDMYEMMNEDEISNRWWNLLFYARTKNLPNLEEYCRTRLFVDLLNSPHHLTGERAHHHRDQG